MLQIMAQMEKTREERRALQTPKTPHEAAVEAFASYFATQCMQVREEDWFMFTAETLQHINNYVARARAMTTTPQYYGQQQRMPFSQQQQQQMSSQQQLSPFDRLSTYAVPDNPRADLQYTTYQQGGNEQNNTSLSELNNTSFSHLLLDQ